MTQRSDTDKIEHPVCLAHSGIRADVKNAEKNIDDLWAAVGQIRMMFAVTMLSTIGTLVSAVWMILSKKVGI